MNDSPAEGSGYIMKNDSTAEGSDDEWSYVITSETVKQQ